MSRAKAGIGVVVAALMVGSVAACGGSDPGGGMSIVAGFYPLQFVAERVGGAQVRVSNLTQPGAEPHDLELSPRQVGEISDATLVLYLHGFQPAVDEAVAQAGSTALDVSGAVPLLPATAGHGEDEGAPGATDPHVWLDPTRLATIADALAQRLAELDPEGAAGYRERATGLRADLTALDGEYAEGLGDCERREVVVSHAAFGYLADRYDLRQIPITGLSPDTEPTPGQLAAAAEEAREVGATTIFFETLVSPAVAQAVAEEVGAGTAVLDPIEGLEPGSGDDYLSVMRANLATLRPALGCS
jgi:zinc transport system substrate-binding protein